MRSTHMQQENPLISFSLAPFQACHSFPCAYIVHTHKKRKIAYKMTYALLCSYSLALTIWGHRLRTHQNMKSFPLAPASFRESELLKATETTVLFGSQCSAVWLARPGILNQDYRLRGYCGLLRSHDCAQTICSIFMEFRALVGVSNTCGIRY